MTCEDVHVGWSCLRLEGVGSAFDYRDRDMRRERKQNVYRLYERESVVRSITGAMTLEKGHADVNWVGGASDQREYVVRLCFV